jgi:SAM-dependent methyltransferase
MILGRWGRARRWLPTKARRVLDIGAAFGFGTSVLARAPDVTWIAGVERDAAYAWEAGRKYTTVPFLQADATQLPLTDQTIDVVLLLDVLEHLAEPQQCLVEAHRILRKEGTLILSVPHRGWLSWLDSLNLYVLLQARSARLPPLDGTEQSGSGCHRHYTLHEITTLLGPRFAIDRVTCTGVGFAELLHLFVLVVCRGLLRSERAYRLARYAYFTAYLLEDTLPMGRAGYHLTVRARAR